MRKVLIAVLILMSALGFSSERPLTERTVARWDSDDGLPHEMILAIAQTPDRQLWLGTWEGLVRFDGHAFSVYDRNNVAEMRDHSVRALAVASDGSLWIGTTRGGLLRYFNGVFEHFGREQGLPSEQIMALAFDQTGKLWVGLEEGGVAGLEGALFQAVTAGLPSGRSVQGMFVDAKNTLWVAGEKGLFQYDGGRFKPAPEGLPKLPLTGVSADASGMLVVGSERGLYRMAESGRFEKAPSPLDRALISTLTRDRGGLLWIGTGSDGLYRIGTQGVDHLGSSEGLPNDRVTAWYEDLDGGQWVGTLAGLARLKTAPLYGIGTGDGLPGNYVRAGLQDRAGRLWIASSSGVARFNQGKLERTFKRADGLPSENTIALFEDAQGGMWVGTFGGGAARIVDDKVERVLDTEAGLGSNVVRALAEDAEGAIWLVGNANVCRWRELQLRCFGTADGLAREYGMMVERDREGVLWVGTSAGLSRFDGKRFQSFSSKDGFDAEDVFDLHHSADGTHWFATDGGLIALSGGTFVKTEQALGIPIATYFGVTEDALGSLWLSSNKGLLKINANQLSAFAPGRISIERFGASEGMPSAQCNGSSMPALWTSRDGKVMAATSKGVAVYDAKVSAAIPQRPPAILLEALNIDGLASNPRSIVDLAAGAHRLEFHYVGIEFDWPERVRYRYRLVGQDLNWISSPARLAGYSNLAPGKYRFEVQAALDSGIFSEQTASIELIQAPHWWQRPKLWIALGVLFGLGGFAVQRTREAALNARALLLEREVELRTRDLHAQTKQLEAAALERESLVAQLDRLARTDSLTGLLNRRAFTQALQSACEAGDCGVALADLDHFKRINDNYSHAAGDAVLQAFARLLQQCLPDCVISRYGGEEFAFLFAHGDRERIRNLLGEVRSSFAAMEFAAPWAALHATVSIGFAIQRPGESSSDLVARADAELYAAKHAGRNRVQG